MPIDPYAQQKAWAAMRLDQQKTQNWAKTKRKGKGWQGVTARPTPAMASGTNPIPVNPNVPQLNSYQLAMQNAINPQYYAGAQNWAAMAQSGGANYSLNPGMLDAQGNPLREFDINNPYFQQGPGALPSYTPYSSNWADYNKLGKTINPQGYQRMSALPTMPPEKHVKLVHPPPPHPLPSGELPLDIIPPETYAPYSYGGGGGYNAGGGGYGGNTYNNGGVNAYNWMNKLLNWKVNQ